jgi:beta-glucanase (GH16 family)
MKTFQKLVFDASFTHNGRPSDDDWTIEVGDQWANAELQSYVDHRSTSWIQNGVLYLRALPYVNGPRAYQSARLNTLGKHAWTYGRFVVRAKLPKGIGAWPAIWMLPNDIKHVGWPLCGEIDLVELVGRKPETVHFSLHTATYNHRFNNHKMFFNVIPSVQDRFHDYRLDWDETSMSFYVDDILQVRFEKQPGDTENEWPFHKPYYLIINLAVGGHWGGPVKEEDLPFTMAIQSVKVYQ